jgi:hypothetical protein
MNPQNIHIMKTTLVILSISLALMFNVYGQDKAFVCTKKSSGKERIIIEGNRMKVVSRDGYVYRGNWKVNHKNDHPASSEIIIGEDTLEISNIESVRSKTLFSKLTGGIFSGTGGFLIISGLLLINSVPGGGSTIGEAISNAFTMMVGIIMTGTGVLVAIPGILFLTIGKNYKANYWNYSIRTI